MAMMNKKYLPEKGFEAASVDLLHSRDLWRDRAEAAEEERTFLLKQLEETVDQAVALREAVKELVAGCREAAVDINRAEQGFGGRYLLGPARDRLQKLADKHAQ